MKGRKRTPELLADIIAEVFEVPVKGIYWQTGMERKLPRITHARQLFASELVRAGWSTTEAARIIGHKTHHCILHSREVIARSMLAGDSLSKLILRVRARLVGSGSFPTLDQWRFNA